MNPADKSAGNALKRALQVGRDLATLRHAAVKRYREDILPAPKPAEPVCFRHDWKPEPAFPGAPRPPASECPKCLTEAEPHRSLEEVRSLMHPIEVDEYPAKPELEEAWGEYELREKPYPPGSFGAKIERLRHLEGSYTSFQSMEAEALERIDDLRAEERERLNTKRGRGRLLWSRIEDGRVVEYRGVKSGRSKWGTRIVRVTP